MEKQQEFILFSVDKSWYEEYWLQPKQVKPKIWRKILLQIVAYYHGSRRRVGEPEMEPDSMKNQIGWTTRIPRSPIMFDTRP